MCIYTHTIIFNNIDYTGNDLAIQKWVHFDDVQSCSQYNCPMLFLKHEEHTSSHRPAAHTD